MTDGTGAPKVCIVNEKFAKKYFRDGNAVGHHIGMGGDPGTKLDIEIVGVVARHANMKSMRDEIPIEVYQPYAAGGIYAGHGWFTSARRAIRSRCFRRSRQVVQQIWIRTCRCSDMKTMEKQMDESLITERLVATLSSAFGFLATLLAAIGLYGVMAYMVARRTREIGIRMALGAASGNVVWLVMREVLVLAGIGIAVGLPAAWGLTR